MSRRVRALLGWLTLVVGSTSAAKTSATPYKDCHMPQPHVLYRGDVDTFLSARDQALDFVSRNPKYRGSVEVVSKQRCHMFMVCSDGQLVRYEG